MNKFYLKSQKDIITIFIVFVGLFTCNYGYSQSKLISVDKSTGTGFVSIPITTISNGKCVVPVSLSYSTTGIKVKDVEGKAGMGWDLNAGGVIVRSLKGLPDDCRQDNRGNNISSWLFSDVGARVQGLSISNDNNNSTCSDDNVDISALNTDFSNAVDTEPDIFSVNAPGLSCQFVFDKDHLVRTIPYKDIKITYGQDSNSGLITSFTIINDAGIKYEFSVTERSGTIPLLTTQKYSPVIYESSISYLKRWYYQYKNGIQYISSWHLSKISDADNNVIYLQYQDDAELDNVLPIEFYIGNANKTVHYFIRKRTSKKRLTGIFTENNRNWMNLIGEDLPIQSVNFDYNTNELTSHSFLSTIKVSQDLIYNLNYTNVESSSDLTRYYLRDITTNQCNAPLKFHFNYYGESFSNGRYISALPDSSSKSIDYWGYANGVQNSSLKPSLLVNPSNQSFPTYALATDTYSRPDYSYRINGANRTSNINYAKSGTLERITYLDNGTTLIDYELNDYLDASNNAVVQGGGLRVKRIVDFDGNDASKNIVRNYTYINPTNNQSSGKPLSMPVFAFTIPYSGGGNSEAEIWSMSTVSSDDDLSEGDHRIVYSFVREGISGSGSTLYEYYQPGTYWDSSADWSPTLVYVARQNCTSLGKLSIQKYAYPFIPSLNIDIERGIIKSVSFFDESNQKVKMSTYNYQVSGPLFQISGLKYDYNANAISYAKYAVNTGIIKLNTQISDTVYDSETFAKSKTVTTIFRYASSQHKLLTQEETQESNGYSYIKNIRYAKDYTLTSNAINSDLFSKALSELQQRNINVPIEQYHQVRTEIDSSPITISSALNKYDIFISGDGYSHVLPSQTLSLISAMGLSDFKPLSLSGNQLVNDSRYNVLNNNLKYDTWGYLQSSSNKRKEIETVLRTTNSHLILAVIKNAYVDEIGYFDNDNTLSTVCFNTGQSSPANYVSGRSGHGLSLLSNLPISKKVQINSQSKFYIFSFWLSTNTSGDIGVTIYNQSNSQSAVYSLPFINSGNKWKYYEMKIPLTNLSSAFTLNFQSNKDVLIDDILLYPGQASIYTSSYDNNNYKIAETDTRGNTNYYKNDVFGRLVLTRDIDGQIKLRKTYVNALESLDLFTPAFGISDKIYAGRPTFLQPFNVFNQCTTNVMYTWNFGDGTPNVTVPYNTDPQSHVFSSTGTYNVSLSISAPGSNTKATSTTINVVPVPIPVVDLLYTNNTQAGSFDYVKLYQGTTLKYTFYKSDFDSGKVSVPRGVYDIQVHCNDIYSSLYSHSDNIANCSAYTKGLHRFSMDLSASSFLNMEVMDTPCN